MVVSSICRLFGPTWSCVLPFFCGDFSELAKWDRKSLPNLLFICLLPWKFCKCWVKIISFVCIQGIHGHGIWPALCHSPLSRIVIEGFPKGLVDKGSKPPPPPPPPPANSTVLPCPLVPGLPQYCALYTLALVHRLYGWESWTIIGKTQQCMPYSLLSGAACLLSKLS